MADISLDLGHDEHAAFTEPSANGNKPTIVGLYGLPGSGKTTMFEKLKGSLGEERFAFFEGSALISELCPGGLAGFKQLSEPAQKCWRECVTKCIKMTCVQGGKTGIVTGHFMFWSGSQSEPNQPVWTDEDAKAYTHILYLDIPAKVVAQRRQNDKDRVRPDESLEHIERWRLTEKKKLRALCRGNGILFVALPELHILDRVIKFLEDFRSHDESNNLVRVKERVDRFVTDQEQLKTMLVMDADRTLTAEDTGGMFWTLKGESGTLEGFFGTSPKYSYTTFRQATLLYEQATTDQEFGVLCGEIAEKVTMYPEMLSFLKRAAKEKHVGIVILTCGLRRVWEEVLKRENLDHVVKVIAGGRIADELVVTPAVKGALVTHLKDAHNMYVWAFGDSPLDLEMLSKADQAIVVVGDKRTRSTTMDEQLAKAMETRGLHARQALLPSNVTPRLDTTELPLVQLTEEGFLESVFVQRNAPQVIHTTDKKAAKLLATSMRDARVGGPALRRAHARVGGYLALEYLTDLIGLEEVTIRHVLGSDTTAYQLRCEKQTTIVALMRGGEPMASGVSDAFPLAMYVHANEPGNVKQHHLKTPLGKQQTIILVDSVVNTGKTIVKFVEHIRNLSADIRIIVVAGVVQDKFLAGDRFADEKTGKLDFTLVALRVSPTKFTGSGSNDTGNRLFNTTHLK
ncbi:MAG: hypothetical protein L6R37_003341 [Teloschistes peruensis]|nr:MAG: hypothetical protein L6R37_003341 [Teloschistes peruensis]